jgi:biotin-(acetyl-CoA carboxylase) ligase
MLRGCILSPRSVDISLFVLGMGVNVDNSFPTACLNDVIRNENKARGLGLPGFPLLPLWTREKVLVAFCQTWERLLPKWTASFSAFEQQYRARWMHTGQVVRLGEGKGDPDEAVRLEGLHPMGYLTAQRLRSGSLGDGDSSPVLLQPGTSSLDMMEGLIRHKS